MKRLPSWLLIPLLLAGCGGGADSDPTISVEDLFAALEEANLTVEPLESGYHTDALDGLALEPVSVLTVRVSDADRNAEPMTFFELAGAKEVARVEGVNGFPLRNWFVAGTVSQHMRRQIEAAVNPEP